MQRTARLWALPLLSSLLACEKPPPVLQSEPASSSARALSSGAIAGPPPRPASAPPTASPSAAPPGSREPAAAPPPVPALYAELFAAGTKLKLRIKTRDWSQGRTKHGELRATCEVERVEVIAGATQSRVTCQGMPEIDLPDPVSGIWTFSGAGLFHHGSELDRKPPITLDERHLVFGPVPQATVRKKTGVEPEDGASVFTIEQQGKAWCSSHDFGGGDPAWSAICLEEGLGVRSGKWGWTGGSTHEAELTRER